MKVFETIQFWARKKKVAEVSIAKAEKNILCGPILAVVTENVTDASSIVDEMQAKSLEMDVHGHGYLSRTQLEKLKSQAEQVYNTARELTESLKVLDASAKLSATAKARVRAD